MSCGTQTVAAAVPCARFRCVHTACTRHKLCCGCCGAQRTANRAFGSSLRHRNALDSALHRHPSALPLYVSVSPLSMVAHMLPAQGLHTCPTFRVVRAGPPCLRWAVVAYEHIWSRGRARPVNWGRCPLRLSAARGSAAKTASMGGVDAIAADVERLRQENERLQAELEAADQFAARGANPGDLPSLEGCPLVLVVDLQPSWC